MKATSASRFGAFVIDAIIVLFVSGLIVGFLPTTKKYDAAAEKQSELIDKILSTEVELDKAYDEIYEIRYELDKRTTQQPELPHHLLPDVAGEYRGARSL